MTDNASGDREERMASAKDERPPTSVRLCPECGYSLEALPEAGRCPECGFYFSAEQIIIYGWEAVQSTFATARSPFAMYFYLVCLGLIFFCSGLGLFFGKMPLIGLCVILAGIAIGALQLAWRRKLLSTMPAPVQLRLFPEGYGARTGLGKVRLEPWTRKTKCRFISKPKSWLVSIQQPSRFFKFEYQNPRIFIEFEADHQLILRAQSQIARWCAAASES